MTSDRQEGYCKIELSLFDHFALQPIDWTDVLGLQAGSPAPGRGRKGLVMSGVLQPKNRSGVWGPRWLSRPR
jgi:hypothetical protein